MKPLDLACRYQDSNGWTCGAQEGEVCNLQTNQGATVKLKFFHAERIEDAASMSGESSPKLDRAIEAVVEEML